MCDTYLESSYVHEAGHVSFDPEDGLGDGDVAPDLRIIWIRRKLAPKTEAGPVIESKARKYQKTLARGPIVPRLHIGFQRPPGLVFDERPEVVHSLADAAAIGQFEIPQIVPGPESTWQSVVMLSSWKIE